LVDRLAGEGLQEVYSSANRDIVVYLVMEDGS
jgi:hypothetical protein